MRDGLSLIEVVFVIVVIGILAAVSLPLFSTTRDDALVSREMANYRMCTRELEAAYIANGTLSGVVSIEPNGLLKEGPVSCKMSKCMLIDIADLERGVVLIKKKPPREISAQMCRYIYTILFSEKSERVVMEEFRFGQTKVKH